MPIDDFNGDLGGGRSDELRLSLTREEARALQTLNAKVGCRFEANSHWLDACDQGDALTAEEAASVAGCSTETIRRWCKRAAQHGSPIGRLFARSAWLVSASRLLDWIESNHDLHARLAAQTRMQNLLKMRLAPQ